MKALTKLLGVLLISLLAFAPQTWAKKRKVFYGDSLSLVALYNSTNGPGWTNKSGWLKSTLDKWHGVTISEGYVTGISLPKNNLRGGLAQFVAAFSNQQSGGLYSLSSIDFSGNALAGEIPEGLITYMTTNINLANNQFTGNAPASLSFSTSLVSVNLSGNYLSGISFNPGGLYNVSSLNLSSNSFSFEDFEPHADWYNRNAGRAVISPQRVIGAPETQVAIVGDAVTLSGTIGGQYNQYQWYKGGSIMSNYTSFALSFPNVSSGDQGDYVLRATNSLISGLILEIAPITLFVRNPISSADSLALVSLYNTTNGAAWKNKANWLKSKVSTWYGVVVTGNRVTQLNLSGNGLSGNLPTALSGMDALQVLDVSFNGLTGGLENAPLKLSGLQAQGNLFTGLPSFNGFSNLTGLDLSQNNLTFEDFEPSALWFNQRGFATLAPQRPISAPDSRNVSFGGSFQLVVQTGGSANSYQWFKDGTAIPNAVNNAYSVNAAKLSDAGDYTLQVTSRSVRNLTLSSGVIKVTVQNPFIDLALTGRYEPTKPIAGQSIAITYTLTNTGGATATGVKVQVSPNGYERVEQATPSQGTYNSTTGIWDVGTVTPTAAPPTLVVKGIVVKKSTICSEVSAASPQDADSTPNNFVAGGGTSLEDDTVCLSIDPEPRIDLELSGNISNTAPIVGTEVSFNLNLVNKGVSPATNLVISAAIPTGFALSASNPDLGTYDANKGQWRLTSLDIGKTATLKLTATATKTDAIDARFEVEAVTEKDVDSTPNNKVNGEDDGFVLPLRPVPDRPPVIVSLQQFETPVPLNTNVPISVQIRDDVGTPNVNLLFRLAGEFEHQTAPMTVQGTPNNGTFTFTGVIPASAVGGRGAEYAVSAKDRAGQSVLSNRVAVPVNLPQGLTVLQCEELPKGEDVNNYRLISIPFALKNKEVRSLLEPSLGAYNPIKWRLFGQSSNSQTLIELGEGDAPLTFEPGRGFWLILREEVEINPDLGEASTVRSDRVFKRNLVPGWTMIGNPFNFRVAKTQISTKSKQPLDIQSFLGNENWGSVSAIDPFVGYIVANNLAGNQIDSLFIDPRLSLTGKTEGEADPMSALKWRVKLYTQMGKLQASETYLGVSDLANEAWDILDRPVPPAFGEYVQTVFEHTDWNRPISRYRADIRPQSTEGKWAFKVETNQKGMLVLRFEPEDFPSNQTLWLYDPITKTLQDLHVNPVFRFEATGEETIRSFEIRISEAAQTIEIPEQTGFTAAYPNPFNTLITLGYALQEKAEVSLEIFDVMGRKLATLKQGEMQEAGFYAVRWDGMQATQTVANGLYLARLRANDQQYLQRIVLQK